MKKRILIILVVGITILFQQREARVASGTSFNGTIAYVSASGYDVDIYLFDLSQNESVKLTHGLTPAWSPDGCKIAYIWATDIFIISVEELDSSNQTNRIESGADDFEHPSWSPNGTRLALTSSMGSYMGLDILQLNDMSYSRVTDMTLRPIAPDWSPDGDQIVFGSNHDSNWDIFTINVDGSELRNLTNYPAKDADPVWSPSGDQIAFSSDRDGNWELYIMNADGSDVRRLTFNDATDAEPDWSPDGEYIAFSSNRSGNWQIYVMDVDGSHVTQITDNFTTTQTPRWRPRECDSLIPLNSQ